MVHFEWIIWNGWLFLQFYCLTNESLVKILSTIYVTQSTYHCYWSIQKLLYWNEKIWAILVKIIIKIVLFHIIFRSLFQGTFYAITTILPVTLRDNHQNTLSGKNNQRIRLFQSLIFSELCDDESFLWWLHWTGRFKRTHSKTINLLKYIQIIYIFNSIKACRRSPEWPSSPIQIDCHCELLLFFYNYWSSFLLFNLWISNKRYNSCSRCWFCNARKGFNSI